MIKLLVIQPPMLDNVGYWRLFRPLDIMSRLYPWVFDITYKVKDLTFADIITSDVIITRRPFGANAGIHLELLQMAVQPGIEKPVIFDEDDAVMACPETHELYSVFSETKRREQYVEALKCASAFWFSTPAFLGTIHPQGIVIPNAILPQDLPDDPAPDNGLFGWLGKTHQAHDLIGGGWDWYEKNKADERVKQWIFFGWKPPLKHAENAQGAAVPYMANVYSFIDSFKKNEARKMFGINAMWKPMIDHPFNDHKSNINYLVATIGGGYCITNYAGRPGWEYASAEILDYDKAGELWRAAKDDIMMNYNLLLTARQRAESIFSLVPQFVNQSQ